MSDEFREIAERLKLATGAESDQALGKLLGLSQSAWSNRKTRGSVPVELINELIAREDLNPEYVYKGTGPVHTPLDGDAWSARFQKKLSAIINIGAFRGILVSQGHKERDLKAVAAGTQSASIELLRDLAMYVGEDLNAMLCDIPSPTAEEKALIEKYRGATDDGKRVIDAVAAFAALTRGNKS